MRRHAKAPSAGSTKRQAKGLGCFLLLALVALLAFAIPAGAAQTHIATLSFGAPGSGSGQLTLAEHSGVAVNETTHDVYVADTGNHRVDQFDSAGNFIRAFGADVGGSGINVCTTGCLAGTSASAPGAFESPTFIAIDNSSSASAGDVYVADTANSTVTKFGADGTLVSGWGTSGQLKGNGSESFSEIAGIAVDATGRLDVFDVFGAQENPLFQFGQDGSFLAPALKLGERGTLQNGFAVDLSGAFFKVNGDSSVDKFKASGENVGQLSITDESETIPTSGLAADPISGELYVDRGGSIDNYAFSPSGEVIGSGCTPAEFAGCSPSDNFGSGELSAGAGLGADGAAEVLYAADAGAGHILAFTPALLPDATTEDADEVIASTATLHGAVNPQGKQLTDCHFEYVTQAAFKSTGFTDLSSGGSATCVPAAASIPPDSSSHAVSADLSGLTPGTTYAFRLVVATAPGAGKGLPRTLTTAIGPPLIGAQSVEVVGLNDATLSAQINPKGAPTTYHVEYGTTASYGQSTPESAPIGFGSDDTEHTVSVHIGGLAPGTAYHFTFVATNVVGSAEGDDTAFATYPSTPGLGSCPNDQFRTGLGGRLPDCRAYEQATPVDKHGANIQGRVSYIQTSSAGDRIDFFLSGGLPTTGGSSSSTPFIASRGASGWSFDGLAPLVDAGFGTEVLGWDEDLSTAVVNAPGPGSVGLALYLRDSGTAVFQLGPGPLVGSAFLGGFAADSSHLIFENRAVLAPGAVPGGELNLYDLDHGDVTLPGRIPAGTATSCDDVDGPACVPAPDGAFAGPYAWGAGIFPTTKEGGASRGLYTQNTISRDGSRVFFTTRNAAQLYVREDGTKTTQISASQATVPDPNGHKPALFMAATPDGSKVFFTSCEKLTDDSTAFSTAENSCITVKQGQDLYSYDVGSGELTDLSVDSDAGDAKGADVQGVLGTSEDGSYVYFVANGVLAPGASPGNCALNVNCNLYVSHGGVTTFIASVSSTDRGNWASAGGLNQKSSRVSADGRTLLFGSTQSLTGYDNHTTNAKGCADINGKAGESCKEVFLYSAQDEELTCVSCNPTGIPASGEAALTIVRFSQGGAGGTPVLTRNLSPDGKRAFFESKDALLPTDTNGVSDVYVWEAKGTGSCESESQNDGCIYLLSSGTSPDPSYFADASVDGDHAFLFTSQQLVPGDKDQLIDIYDAGVGDGLASQHALAPPTCTGTACQANPAPPPDQTMSSAAFSGPGNAHRPPVARKCPKGKRKVRSAGKVHCQKAGKKQHKRHTNRGGSK